MNAELEGYLDQLLSIRQSVPGLVTDLSSGGFNWRPAPDRWSIAQSFGHLNQTAQRLLPAIEAAVMDAYAHNLKGKGPFVYPLLERLFVWAMEPPPRFRTKTPKAFQPAPEATVDEVIPRFMEYQDRLAELISAADGLDLRRARHRSPAIPLFAYSLGTSFAVTLAHERRHVWQARQVRNASGFPR